MDKWCAAVVIIGLLHFLDSSYANTESSRSTSYTTDTHRECQNSTLLKECVESTFPKANQTNCELWTKARNGCLIDSGCSDNFIALLKRVFEQRYDVQCDADRDDCKFPGSVKPCVQKINPKDFETTCDAWTKLKGDCLTQCNDNYIKKVKLSFEKRYGVQCNSDWEGMCISYNSPESCLSTINPAYYTDKCSAWDKLKACYDQSSCLSTYIKRKRIEFQRRYDVTCLDVKVDDTLTNTFIVTTECSDTFQVCSTSKPFNCKGWHTVRKCFDKTCVYDEVEIIKKKTLSETGLTCGTGSAMASIGIIILAGSVLLAR